MPKRSRIVRASSPASWPFNSVHMRAGVYTMGKERAAAGDPGAGMALKDSTKPLISSPSGGGSGGPMNDNRLTMTLDQTQLEILEGDITELEVDAIVNPANAQLQLGSGVAGAIRERGGPSIQEECNRIGGTPVGTAVMTGAGHLKAKRVIHTVGPVMGEGDEDKKLASAVRAALALADRRGLKSIAVPAIS